MSDRPAVFTIPSHRSFADALATGLIQRFGKDPLGLARGRILLPNNRAVRAVTDAFVRASGNGLLLPRMIPVGDPELDERIGGALDRMDDGEPVSPAIDPTERVLTLAAMVRGDGAAASLRLATDLARTLDALLIETIEPRRLKDAVAETTDLANHWQRSLEKLKLIYDVWPHFLADRGQIDLAERRNQLLRQIAGRWKSDPPPGFTIAAGITTAAPAVAALIAGVSRMPQGMVVLPGLWLADVMSDAEWEALGPDERGRREETHPQFHLKQLLDRMGIARPEVELWHSKGGAASSPARARAVANAMTAPDFSHKWENLPRADRRLTGVRLAMLPDAAAEAQAIALALREALETPAKTAALVTPDRQLASRVSALLARWGIEADDSAGRPLSQSASGTLLLGIAAAAAEELAPVALLALAKHPLVGGEADERLAWLDAVRTIDLKLRGPRPPAGLTGLDARFEKRGVQSEWPMIRARLSVLDGLLRSPIPLGRFAGKLAEAAEALTGDAAWRGPAGRMAAELLAELQGSDAAAQLLVDADDAVPLLRQLLDKRAVRPPYGGHPRIFIWGLLEARLQRADLVILGGLNEGVWPALPAPDPWLPPKVRAELEMPTLDARVGLSAHDFASALGAPEVLITRAARDSRSPTIPSRFWLRLLAMDPELVADGALSALVAVLDDPGAVEPAEQPAPRPTTAQRPKVISVTNVDRLKADPFEFYAKAILKLRKLDPLDADPTAAWKGTAVHEVLQLWLQQDGCAADALIPRAEALLRSEAVHPLLRALWQPRVMEAIRWIAAEVEKDRAEGRLPYKAEAEGGTEIAGILLKGKADRIDRLPDGALAIIDYKTGQAPKLNAVEAGFALQLGLLGLIAEAHGFPDVAGRVRTFEYWSLAKDGRTFGKRVRADKNLGPDDFLAHARHNFEQAAGDWLTGERPFTAKLNPAYAPYGDYNQLMRLEEWYGRK
jgi:ATP-dependent helicase/nuclease subunit B